LFPDLFIGLEEARRARSSGMKRGAVMNMVAS
jgi:hypothetical protein